MGFFSDLAFEEGFFRRSGSGYRSVSRQASLGYVQRRPLVSKEAFNEVAVHELSKVAFSVSVGVQEMLAVASSSMNQELNTALRTYSQNSKYIINRRVGWANAMQRVGEQAQQRILDKYDALPKGPRYRVGINRYAGGALRGAIAHPTFFLASRDGISFINTGMLNNKAKQWARFNYGARGTKGGIGSNRQFPLVFFGQRVGTLGLNRPPSPGFKVPRGVFIDQAGQIVRPQQKAWGGQDRFYTVRQFNVLPSVRRAVGGQAKAPSFFGPIESRGIVGRRVFDAGVEHIARNMPREFERLIVQAFEHAATGAPRGGGGPLGKAGVSPEKALRSLNTLTRNL